MMRIRNWGLACASAMLLATVSMSVFAQATPGANGQDSAQGQPGRAQRGGGALLAAIPVSVLDTELKLNAEQKTKITEIQEKVQADTKKAQEAAQNGGQVDRRAMAQASQQASKDIEALLNDEQKKKLPDLYKAAQMYGSVGIPIGVVADLKLKGDLKTKITTIAEDTQKNVREAMQSAQNGGDRQAAMQAAQAARKEGADKVLALLTEDQKTTLQKYVKDHPQELRAFGGGGRRRPTPAAPPA
jgi:hypothetical protein